jgi:large subunit ribosomal protein L30
MIAIIRIRGTVGVKKDIKYTLTQIGLNKPNHCILIQDNEQNKGIIKKIKDYVAFGEINNETLKKLIEKRGKYSNKNKINSKDVEKIIKLITENKIKETKINKVFRLNPPLKGFKRSTKSGYNQGGMLGNNKEKINDLLLKMI